MKSRMNQQETTTEPMDCALGRNVLGSHFHPNTQVISVSGQKTEGRGQLGFIVNNNSMVSLRGIPNPSQF